jgi:hypothetical protein
MRKATLVEPATVTVRRNPDLSKSSEMQVCINDEPIVRIAYGRLDNASQWALAERVAKWLREE